MKFTMTTMAASSITQLRTTITSRLEMDWKISRPRPRQVKHVFHHDGAGQQLGKLQAHDGDDRDQRIAQHMAPQRGALRQALGARGAHEVLAQHLQHGRAGDARQDGRLHHGQRDGRQQQRLNTRPAQPSSQPGKPPAANHLRCTETAGSAGWRTRSWEWQCPPASGPSAHVTQLVVARGGIDAGRSASTVVIDMAMSASGTVTVSRSSTSSTPACCRHS
jgi:hypothetical protein